MAEKITVHDPRGYPPKVQGKPLAPRLETRRPRSTRAASAWTPISRR